MTEIIYTKKGLANNFGNWIEINEKLKRPGNRELLELVLKHELSHTDKTTIKDLLMDLKPQKKPKSFWKFILKNPDTWYQFLPFYKSSVTGKVYVDWILTAVWCTFLGLFAIAIKLWSFVL